MSAASLSPFFAAFMPSASRPAAAAVACAGVDGGESEENKQRAFHADAGNADLAKRDTRQKCSQSIKYRKSTHRSSVS